MPVLEPRTAPPPDYYADNLLRLVQTVRAQYNDLLTAPELALTSNILNLGGPARRLYARLIGRRGPLFRVDRLAYREVPDVRAALGELAAAGLVRLCGPTPADRLLAEHTIAELAQSFPHVCRSRKGDFVAHIAARYPDREILRRLAPCSPWVELGHPLLVRTLCALFFGDANQDLTTFVLEDLGVTRFEPYDLDGAGRLFAERVSLDDYLELTLSVGRRLERLRQMWCSEAAEHEVARLWDESPHRFVERRRSRLLNQLGALAERARDHDVALTAYARSTHAPARERRTRLLARLGDFAGAGRLLHVIGATPGSRLEAEFAARFDPHTLRLRRAPAVIRQECLRLAAPPELRDTSSARRPTPGVLEGAALAALLTRPGIGAHLENRFSLSFFGLAFWDIVFAPIRGAFLNPYQLGPVDLFWSDFAAARAPLLERRIDELRSPDRLAARVLDTWHHKRGVSNALVAWDALSRTLIERAVAAVPIVAWQALFDRLANDLREARTGFPDLALFYDDGGYEFVEVKGPGDQLRAEQRLWFSLFDRAGVSARVLRVDW